MHFPDSKRATRWEYVILKGAWSATAVDTLEELQSSFPGSREMLQLSSCHVELVVIDLGFFDARLQTGRWGDTACLSAPLAQRT